MPSPLAISRMEVLWYPFRENNRVTTLWISLILSAFLSWSQKNQTSVWLIFSRKKIRPATFFCKQNALIQNQVFRETYSRNFENFVPLYTKPSTPNFSFALIRSAHIIFKWGRYTWGRVVIPLGGTGAGYEGHGYPQDGNSNKSGLCAFYQSLLGIFFQYSHGDWSSRPTLDFKQYVMASNRINFIHAESKTFVLYHYSRLKDSQGVSFFTEALNSNLEVFYECH